MNNKIKLNVQLLCMHVGLIFVYIVSILFKDKSKVDLEKSNVVYRLVCSCGHD